MIKLANAPTSIYDVISYGKRGMSILTMKLHTTKIVSCVTPGHIQLVERKSHTTCRIQLVEPKSYRVSWALCPGSTCNSTVVEVELHLQRNRR